jgi:hypothetical protein
LVKKNVGNTNNSLSSLQVLQNVGVMANVKQTKKTRDQDALQVSGSKKKILLST